MGTCIVVYRYFYSAGIPIIVPIHIIIRKNYRYGAYADTSYRDLEKPGIVKRNSKYLYCPEEYKRLQTAVRVK